MSGAYVAKPAVAVDPPEGPPTVDDVPFGWDLDWPFCGTSGHDPDPFFPAPHPPGYTPDYSFAMTATESIAPDGTASVTGSLRDHLTFATNEPTPVIWTATVASSPSRSINLRFSGDSEYASGISSDCAFETYWGVTPDIEFELEEDDIGGIVTLTGTSTIGGVAVSQTVEIEVEQLTATITFTSNTETNPQWGAAIEIEGQESGEEAYGIVGLEWPGAEDTETEDEISVSKTSTTMEVQVDVFREEVYDVRIGYASIQAGTINMVWILTIGEDEYTKEVDVVYDSFYNVDLDDTWLTIDGETGEVTVINP